MNPTQLVQRGQGFGEIHANRNTLSDGQPGPLHQHFAYRLGDVVRGIDRAACDQVIRRFHDVIEETTRFVLANMKNADPARMGAGDWFKIPDNFEFTLEGPGFSKVSAINDFDGAVRPSQRPGQPDFPKRALADGLEQLKVGYLGFATPRWNVLYSGQGRRGGNNHHRSANSSF